MNAAKVLNEKIKNHSVEIPWPPKEKDLGSNNVAEYIPELLDIFCTILLSGQALDRDKSKSNCVVRLKNSLTQDIVYSASNSAIKTPKSVLFPAVVKALCNNTGTGTGTGTHKLYWHVTHLQSKLPKQYLKDL